MGFMSQKKNWTPWWVCHSVLYFLWWFYDQWMATLFSTVVFEVQSQGSSIGSSISIASTWDLVRRPFLGPASSLLQNQWGVLAVCFNKHQAILMQIWVWEPPVSWLDILFMVIDYSMLKQCYSTILKVLVKKSLTSQVVAHTFNLRLRQRQADLCEG